MASSIANDWQSDFSWSGPGNIFSLYSVTIGIPTLRMRPDAPAPASRDWPAGDDRRRSVRLSGVLCGSAIRSRIWAGVQMRYTQNDYGGASVNWLSSVSTQ
jgi:hypothetical protein